jgi:hypothetical protein
MVVNLESSRATLTVSSFPLVILIGENPPWLECSGMCPSPKVARRLVRVLAKSL